MSINLAVLDQRQVIRQIVTVDLEYKLDQQWKWDELAVNICRLFEGALVTLRAPHRDIEQVVVIAERILDATDTLAGLVENEDEPQSSVARHNVALCEAKAQLLFDACIRERDDEILQACAESGLIVALGLGAKDDAILQQ